MSHTSLPGLPSVAATATHRANPTTAVPPSIVAPHNPLAPRCDTIAKIQTSTTPSDNFTTTDAPPNHQSPTPQLNLGTVVSPNGFPQIDLRETSFSSDVKCCSRAFANRCCRWIVEAEEPVSSPTRNATRRTARATAWQNQNGVLTDVCFFPGTTPAATKSASSRPLVDTSVTFTSRRRVLLLSAVTVVSAFLG